MHTHSHLTARTTLKFWMRKCLCILNHTHTYYCVLMKNCNSSWTHSKHTQFLAEKGLLCMQIHTHAVDACTCEHTGRVHMHSKCCVSVISSKCSMVSHWQTLHPFRYEPQQTTAACCVY